jgi:hypothetical protein
MRNIKHMLSVFMAAALVGAFAFTATTAKAFQRRVHASVCIADRVSHNDIASTINGLSNSSLLLQRSVQCQVPEDTNVLKQAITGVRVHGLDANTLSGVVVQACATNWSVPGGSCGAAAGTGGAFTGNYSLAPSLVEWGLAANLSDYIYLNVTLPAVSLNGTSTVRGFWLTN